MGAEISYEAMPSVFLAALHLYHSDNDEDFWKSYLSDEIIGVLESRGITWDREIVMFVHNGQCIL